MLTTAIKAARAAGDVLLQNQSANNATEYKDSHSVVSKVDVAAEKVILEILETAFPSHSIFSEEKGLLEKNPEYLWIIDPLDGTTNYLRNLGHSCVSIGLAKNNEMVLGVVFDPFRQELFTAEAGKGATRNDTKLETSTVTEMDKAVISMGRAGDANAKREHGELLHKLVNQVRSIHVTGATALAIPYVAAGRYDAHINSRCNTYDCAAANIIAQEAGLVVTDFEGNTWKPDIKTPSNILVTSKVMHPLFLKAIVS